MPPILQWDLQELGACVRLIVVTSQHRQLRKIWVCVEVRPAFWLNDTTCFVLFNVSAGAGATGRSDPSQLHDRKLTLFSKTVKLWIPKWNQIQIFQLREQLRVSTTGAVVRHLVAAKSHSATPEAKVSKALINISQRLNDVAFRRLLISFWWRLMLLSRSLNMHQRTGAAPSMILR